MRKFLELLPNVLQRKLVRRLFYFEPVPSPHLSVRIAQTKEELEAAFRLLHDAYVSEGYMEPNASGMRVTLYHALPSTTTVIALWDEKVVGTFSIIRDSGMGLPLESVFDVSPFRKKGKRIAEISSLAIDPQFRGTQGSILFPLLKYLYNYCYHYFGIDCLVIAVNPKHTLLYESLLLFEPITNQKIDNYSFVNGAPAVGEVLDIRTCYRVFKKTFEKKYESQDLFTYFRKMIFRNLVYPDRNFKTLYDPVMTPELLDYFFVQKTSLFEKLTERQRETLAKIYNHPKFSRLPFWTEKPTEQRELRWDFHGHCIVRVAGEAKIFPGSVYNISKSGLCIRFKTPQQITGKRVKVKVRIGPNLTSEILAVVIWEQSNGMTGLKVEKASSNYEWLVTTIRNLVYQERTGLACKAHRKG